MGCTMHAQACCHCCQPSQVNTPATLIPGAADCCGCLLPFQTATAASTSPSQASAVVFSSCDGHATPFTALASRHAICCCVCTCVPQGRATVVPTQTC